MFTRRVMRGLVSGLLAACVLASSGEADDGDSGDGPLDASNVYQRIKDADEHGLSIRRFAAGADDAAAQIVLDEQGEASGGRGNDAAPRPLFRRVAEQALQQGVYPEFIALLDNYVVRSQERESYTDQEQEEIDDFLDEALATRPMQVALVYLRENLGQELGDAEFREKVEEIWFGLYTNHFGGRPVAHCSGFEHVFVGEGQFGGDSGGTRRGEVSGYHSWVKFFQDERNGDVNYIGHKYDLPAARRPSNPCVITLRMIWNHDPDGPGGEAEVELFKPKGGFFVGTSPECELAMGTVAFFESQAGRLPDDKRRVVLDGATYDLVLYTNVESNGRRGNFVRSFFPVLIGQSQSGDDGDAPPADGPVAIVRSLPNPDGDDETGEWVELKNRSGADVDLGGWELRDRQGGARRLDGVLRSGQTRRFEIPRAAHEMRLGNAGGTIRLFQGDELVDQVRYGRASSGQVIEFDR